MKNIKIDKSKAVKIKTGAGSSAEARLLDALSECEGYSMKTQEAIELLYPGDKRPAAAIKNSFATAKSHCWSKLDYRLEFEGDNIKITGERKPGSLDEYYPIA